MPAAAVDPLSEGERRAFRQTRAGTDFESESCGLPGSSWVSTLHGVRQVAWCGVWAMVAASAGACGGSNESKAVAATAVMVAATGVNRALTKECWAACTPGYVCNHESGLCEPGECQPSCQETQVCARVEGQFVCIDKGYVYNSNVKGRGPTLPSGGPPRAAARSPRGSIASVEPEPAAGCATPGSEAWFADAERAPSEPSPKHADFVGVWAIENAPVNASGARPLIVALDWFGRSADAATHYRAVAEAPTLLSLDVWSELSPEPTRLEVEMVSRDRIKLRGVQYQREDCMSASPPPACCELPRASWVHLGPGQTPEAASVAEPIIPP